MYTDRDIAEISAIIRRHALLTALAVCVPLIAFVAAVVLRVKWLAFVCAALMAGAAVFGGFYYVWPGVCYRRFIRGVRGGIIVSQRARVLSIDDAVEVQDGARVRRVHIELPDGAGERIVYLNVSKCDRFPQPGADVDLKLCGRHIVDVAQ